MNAPESRKSAETGWMRLEHFRPAMIKPSQKCCEKNYLISFIPEMKYARSAGIGAAASCGDQIISFAASLISLSSGAGRALIILPMIWWVLGGSGLRQTGGHPRSHRSSGIYQHPITRIFGITTKVLTSLLSNVYAPWKGTKAFGPAGAALRAGRFMACA